MSARETVFLLLCAFAVGMISADAFRLDDSETVRVEPVFESQSFNQSIPEYSQYTLIGSRLSRPYK